MKKTNTMSKRYRQVFIQWVATLLPVAAVVFSALFVFKEAVRSSIASTPHPELVYAILGAFFLGVVLATDALWRYTVEGNLIERWSQTAPDQREKLIRNGRHTYMMPVYQILLGKRELSGGVRQSILEQEMNNIKAHLDDRLALPHYLAGALVGLGLVGTFVGLLGTLDDLGKLFGALANTDNNASANPADLFADMVRRLQDPMRGMGTAFVASLYGLLGSLVLGLQILTVGRTGHNLNSEMHTLLRDEETPAPAVAVGAASDAAVAPVLAPQAADLLAAFHSVIQAQNQQWQQVVQSLIQEQATRLEDSHALLAEQSAAMRALLDQMRDQSDQHQQSHRLAINEQAHLWDRASQDMLQQAERGQQDTQVLKSEIQRLVTASQTLAQSVRHNQDAEERYRRDVPRTSYWQDAWAKVQTYLQKSGTDHAMADMSSVMREQAKTLQQMSKTLSQIDKHLAQAPKQR